MNSTLFIKLDDYLAGRDHESMDWCDGGEAEIAERIVQDFVFDDWHQVRENWRAKNIQWQGCLVSILSPHFGSIAQEILVDMAQSKNQEIAFEAMYTISFYCGINANSEGLFYDEHIEHCEFKAKIKENQNFLEAIPKIGALVGRKYEMLQNILQSKP